MVKCKHCKKENKANVKFCVHCGKKLVEETHKEHKPVQNKGVSKFLKTTGRILAYIVFGFIVLIALFTFSGKSFIALILAGLGIFIALPKFNSFTQKKFKKTLPTWAKIISLIVIFYIAVMLLGGSEDSGSSNEVNLKGLNAEEVLGNYLDLLNYNGVNELLSNNLQRQKLSSGIVEEQLKLDYDYMGGLKAIFDDLQKSCNEAKQMGYDACGDAVSSSLSTSTSAELLSKEVTEETESETKIAVKNKVTSFSNNEKTETVRDITYILKKTDKVWQVSDIIDEDGKLLSETLNVEKRKQDDEKRLSELKASFEELKKPIEEMKGIYQLAGNLKAKVQSSLPDNQIISFDFGSYNNQTDKFVIGVTYHFKEQWLVDDYLGFLGDASKIYKAIFTSSNKIMQVQITAKQKYKDNYGKEQEKFLGRSLMTKATADKISWEGFESSSLDKITSVSFYGDSFYKDLTDLQNDLENWQSVPSYGGGFGSLPASVCSDAKTQCQAYGECDTLDMLKSQGMC